MKIKFETERLIIREFVVEDAIHLCELDSNPQVMKYIAKADAHPHPIEYGLEKVHKQIARYKLNDGLGVWVVTLKDTNEFMGWICLNELGTSDLIEIGYRYHTKFWGKGYGTEAAIAVMDYGFNEVNLKHIVAIAMEDNIASRRIMDKIGLSYVGWKNFYGKDVVFYEKWTKTQKNQKNSI